MRASDPDCEISFRERYPDDEEDLIDDLNTTRAGTKASRRIGAFFAFSGGSAVKGDSPLSIPMINAGLLVWRLFAVGDFFGLVDGSGGTLQVMIEKNGRCWVEVPAVKEGGAYGKFVRRDELREVIKSLPERITPQVVEGLRFTPY